MQLRKLSRLDELLMQFRAFRVIFILAVTGVFDYYFMGLVAFALPQLQRQFHVADMDVGPVLGLLRLGFIPALLITVLADFIGRKPFILFTNVMLIVASLASAMAGTLGSFLVAQFLGFMFISAETSVAVVMIIEEAKSRRRGFSVSLLSALSSTGTAGAALVYGMNEYLHFRFQYSYYYGILPLLIVLFLRTRLQETGLFRSKASASPAMSMKQKIREWGHLLRAEAGLLFLVCLIVLLNDACVSPAYILASKFLQEQQNFKPLAVTAIIIASGFFATVGTVVICYLSDIAGRKKILIGSMGLTIVAVISFYHSVGYFLFFSWFLFIILSATTSGLLTTIGTELFPTATRASATGVRGMFSAIGGAAGLVLEGWLDKKTHSNAVAVSILTIFILFGLILVYYKIPETAQTNLPDLSEKANNG